MSVQLPEAITPQVCLLLQRYDLLEPLLRKVIFEQELHSIELSVADLDVAEQRARESQDLVAQDRFELWMQQQQLTYSRYRELLTDRERRVQLIQRRFGAKAEARFLERKNQLDRVVYSLLRVDDRDLARELYFRLQAGEADFAQLAAQYAQGPERQTRGVVGPVPLTQAHPQLAERLRTSQVGQLLEPFSIEPWWLVVRLESYVPASLDASTHHQMASELFEQWLDQEVSSRVIQLEPILTNASA